MAYTLDYMLVLVTTATLLASAIIPMGGYVPANIPNPLNDLFGGLGITTTTTGSATTTSANNPQNVQRTAALQGCLLGGLTGALVGAGVFGVLGLGVGAIPGAIVGFVSAGGAGCLLGAGIGSQFPVGTTQLFSSIISSTGPIGVFLQGVLAVEQYVYPFVQFAIDWIPYENALVTYEPAFASLWGVFVVIASMLWILKVAEMFRGIGVGA